MLDQPIQTIGVISDIHANFAALEAVLDYMAQRQTDALFFLGDYVTDGPDPARTLQLLRRAAERYPCVFIRGNREQYLIDHDDHPAEVWRPGPSSGSLLYTYQRLTAQDLQWFRSMPICHSFEEMILCHGSPGRVNELVEADGTNSVSGENTHRWLQAIDRPLLLCGHTHRQGLTCRPDLGPSDKTSDPTFDKPLDKTLLNPGSIGLPHNHDAQARAALLHRVNGAWQADGQTSWQAELVAVPYDIQIILDAYHNSELMEMAPAWSHANCQFIATGHNYILRLLRATSRFAAAQHMENIPLSQLPTEIWMQAAKELNLL